MTTGHPDDARFIGKRIIDIFEVLNAFYVLEGQFLLDYFEWDSLGGIELIEL